MPQQAANWGDRPSKKKPAAPEAVDRFISGKGATVRLNVEVPADMRAAVKSKCALQHKEIKDVVVELLARWLKE